MQSKIIQITTALLAAISTPVAHSACNIINGEKHGDCANVTVTTQQTPIGRPLEVRSSSVASGIISGATIYAGGQLTLSGISRGDIVVKRGGRLVVSGTVGGVIRNDGGDVRISGIVTQLVSSGGTVTVSGIVRSFSGAGPVMFSKDSVLAEKVFTTDTRLP